VRNIELLSVGSDELLLLSETDRFALLFSGRWKRRLELLSRGQLIEAECRIDSSVANLIYLNECELRAEG